MRIARLVIAAVLLAGCAAVVPTQGLEPGRSTAAQVVAQMGEPAMRLERPGGGELLYFPHWPWGRVTYVAAIGPDGVLRGLEQRLNYQNIHSVQKGMSKDEVRRLLGPPNEVSRLPRQQREVWEYPWIHAVREGRVLWVQFSDDGIVREAIEMHDYERDPENDFSSLRSSLLSTLP
jgi:outer membrane protein assembly factor BamE (lipoprotein component of BamABCDE complex)